ncbi:hypothetical protein [Fluviicola sp.]|uniref:hypothetical protein n=1 Tax=Fluviicola sp. TaxID=1917219 RepID=UPI003D2AE0FF
MKLCLTFLIIFVCSLTNLSSAQLNPEQNAEAELYRKNKVKTISFYEYRDAKRHGKGKLTSYSRLDTLGREIESWSNLKLSLFRSTNYQVFFEYNENGDVSKRISFVIEGSDPLITTYTYRYNDQQKITYKKEDSQFGELWKHTYDSLGNRIRTQWYFAGDSIKNPFYFIDSFYYAGNQLQVMKRFNPDKSLYFYFTYEYNEQGNCIREIRHEKERITDVWEWTYDEKGNRTHGVYSDKLAGTTNSSETEYTANGLRTLSEGKRKIVYEYY